MMGRPRMPAQGRMLARSVYVWLSSPLCCSCSRAVPAVTDGFEA